VVCAPTWVDVINTNTVATRTLVMIVWHDTTAEIARIAGARYVIRS
jgi:hypothetical protein